MKFRIFFLTLSLIGSTTSYLHADVSPIIQKLFFSQSNKDPRLIGLTTIGVVSAITGIYILKNGLEKTFSSKENQSSQNVLKNGLRRFGGLLLTTTGLAISASGIGLTLFSKEILTKIELYKFES